jgi:hypothetical protein
MHTVREQNARLECHFDLEGEALYSVKWYKDGNEFFRYVPRDQPPAQLFSLPGVTVDVSTYWNLQCIQKSSIVLSYKILTCQNFNDSAYFTINTNLYKLLTVMWRTVFI